MGMCGDTKNMNADRYILHMATSFVSCSSLMHTSPHSLWPSFANLFANDSCRYMYARMACSLLIVLRRCLSRCCLRYLKSC